MQFIDVFVDAVIPGGSIIDIGAGKGNWSEFFRSKGFRVVAVDVRSRPESLSDAISWEETDAIEWAASQPSDSVDGIFLRNVIQFIESSQVINNLVPHLIRITRPGGVIAIETFTAPPQPDFGSLKGFYRAEVLAKSFAGWTVLLKDEFKNTSSDMKGAIRDFSMAQLIVKKPSV